MNTTFGNSACRSRFWQLPRTSGAMCLYIMATWNEMKHTLPNGSDAVFAEYQRRLVTQAPLFATYHDFYA